MKVIELFAGIGSQTQALKNLKIDHEVVCVVEWDKYAYQSYQAIHGPTLNLGDITKVEELPPCDLLTYSFPCQDVSVAGKQGGLAKGSGTRSGLLWEVERLLLDYADRMEMPKYLLMENVKNLVGKQHKPHFEEWLRFLESLGYENHWAVLNAKNYGIPQNRERVFCVSIHGGGAYEWPEPFDNGLRLRDFLEAEVDEKYYLEEEKVGDSINFENLASTTRRGRVGKGVAQTINTMTSQAVVEPNELKIVGRVEGIKGHDYNRRVYSEDGASPSLAANSGGNLEPKILTGYRIRKLTPKECWRLMGFTDEAFEWAEMVCSNSQLYKQAGNSIVVQVLEGIFENLFIRK